ncbi:MULTISPECIES: hypothetical protein [Romboutsia]|uniref:hypothetical protein n=1 Tax=Romboutsia TaxID=1501226 RepID=UPI00189E730B|nr:MULTISPECIES: hypothetical protein [Romboutsia]MCH1959569.1 hypothetical protein [Romboutsia hominis]MCH1970008.1 hypothetical protein [Romboutsia hominis]MDB8791163.1 hypothetical protein [Romboutsia sp. 1001216sp1]MDB8800803.1 hypothetical protein [Romboutsia sp. 1001216sp1]MDB8812202.1 hypothetical protein [Romboutsia sp. 1001216sp1]
MKESIKLYKSVSLDILNKLKSSSLINIGDLFDKRQEILSNVLDFEAFKIQMIDEGILEIDREIHILLSDSIEKTKDEIKNHKLSNRVNTSYLSTKKENLNIFNKKV